MNKKELLKKYNKNKSNLKLLNRNCLNSKIATNTDKMIRSILKWKLFFYQVRTIGFILKLISLLIN